MRDMKTLEEIGLQEVSRKTHIEVKTLQYMVDKQFDKLGRINTLGFLKIVSREFHLDLTQWQEEFEEYWKSTKDQDDSKDPVFMINTPSSPLKPLRFVLVLVALAAVALWYFDAWEKARVYFEENMKQEAPVAFTVAPVVEEAKESLDLVQQVPTEEVGAIEQETNASVPAPLSLEVPSVEVPATPETAVEEAVAEEKVVTSVHVQEGTIIPNVNIWVGIVYLDTMKRASHLTSNAITLDFSREQIITTGHGNFTLVEEEERHAYTSQLPKRFHIKNNVLREISYQEFVTLNKGTAW
ncbi:MAG: hypothetical protein IBX45_03135 [Campylobacterales bacterium]|nr:hypothetical protein [Campylobacterales bacterium]